MASGDRLSDRQSQSRAPLLTAAGGIEAMEALKDQALRFRWDTRTAVMHEQLDLPCPASSPLADWRQSSWPVRGTDRPPVVAGDNRGAMTLEATRKLSHLSVRAIASTDFL